MQNAVAFYQFTWSRFLSFGCSFLTEPMLISYEQGEIEMQPGDLLIGFTDGISEAMNPDDEEWGEEQMIEAVKVKIELPAREMLDYLVVCADNFANGAK